MKSVWTCKCGARHDPEEDEFSWWQCRTCAAWRWPGLLWVGSAVVGLGLVILLWQGLGALEGNAEDRFLARATEALRTGGQDGEITSEEAEALRRRATRLELSAEEMTRLLEQAKALYLETKRRTLLDQSPGKETLGHADRKALCTVAAAMGVQAKDCSASLQDIMVRLSQGAFGDVQTLLERMPATPEKEELASMLNIPLGVEIRLQYQKGRADPSPLHPINAPALRDLTFSHRDNYRLLLDAPQDKPQNKSYMYVFQKDHYGQITRLFPDPVWSQIGNPLQPGTTYQIPAAKKEWLYLDELPPAQRTVVQETLYFIASPWQANDLEELYGDICGATTRDKRKELITHFLTKLRVRQTSPFKAVYYQELAFNHER